MALKESEAQNQPKVTISSETKTDEQKPVILDKTKSVPLFHKYMPQNIEISKTQNL